MVGPARGASGPAGDRPGLRHPAAAVLRRPSRRQGRDGRAAGQGVRTAARRDRRVRRCARRPHPRIGHRPRRGRQDHRRLRDASGSLLPAATGDPGPDGHIPGPRGRTGGVGRAGGARLCARRRRHPPARRSGRDHRDPRQRPHLLPAPQRQSGQEPRGAAARQRRIGRRGRPRGRHRTLHRAHALQRHRRLSRQLPGRGAAGDRRGAGPRHQRPRRPRRDRVPDRPWWRSTSGRCRRARRAGPPAWT